MADAGRRVAGGRALRPTAAVVLATAPTPDGGPAAVLPLGGIPLLRRLLEQLAGLGVGPVHVVTRPGWYASCAGALRDLPGWQAVESPDTAADLAVVAELATDADGDGDGDGDLLIALGDVVTHREALAGLLADPRVGTGILSGGSALARPWAPRTRSSRGRVLAASSPYHLVQRPTSSFLGVLKVHGRDRAALADVARRLAGLATSPRPPDWEEELAAKAGRWHGQLARHRAREVGWDPADADPGTDWSAVPLPPEDERTLQARHAALREDVTSLVLVGLVRSGVPVSNAYLRELFWARPLDAAGAGAAEERMRSYDEDDVLLRSAVKGSDGFFTTFFVSPYSRYLARWAARHGWTPNAVTTLSMAIGAAAAAAFATGSRAGMVAGAVLLQLAFTADCVDGQLARYTRTFSSLGAWLDSVFDRGKEYLVFAGLAVGAGRGWGDDVWTLAAAALALQTARHAVDFSFAATRHHAMAAVPLLPLEQPRDTASVVPTEVDALELPPAAGVEGGAEDDARGEDRAGAPARRRPGIGRRVVRLSRWSDRRSGLRWAKRIVVLPIGERFALISVTAAVSTPRTTFVALLAWGSAATAYGLTGKLARSVAR